MTARESDPLLAAVRQQAALEAERSGELAHLDKLASPDLGEGERAELEKEAARTAEGAELAALLRPIDAAGRARASAAAAAALRGAAAAPAEPAAPSSGVAALLESAAPSNVVPFKARARAASEERSRAASEERSRSGRWAAIGGALALAAGAAVFVVTRSPALELPVYEASLVGGARDVRGDESGRTFLPGKPLRVRLRPDHAVNLKLGAIAALRQGDRTTRLAAAVEALEGGALQVLVTLPVPPAVQPGRADIIVLVADLRALSTAQIEEASSDPQQRLVIVPLLIGSP